MTMQPLYLVDASIYIFRAYFSIPEHLTDIDGNPANAVYGFAGFLGALLENAQAFALAFFRWTTSRALIIMTIII
jgi:5'-3' exonuclease